ncbi:MAG: hydroxymethylglutaryl-CoA lyase [Gammaproteobacteria bacterium]|jgi:hydroxymethylglutaryl-CoA lyase|nr:hydroxymethylglutaryl-CoA lyase [Gammaproteobacteria bacterium]NCF80415.1 hydroxymethylglutaryl-CoA lyase [Pseudomonadota bacterium]
MRTGVDVEVREVGLRDGLQSVSTFFPSAEKIAWIRAEAACGMPEIEVCSFVPPKLIPQFTDAVEIVAAALEIPNLSVSALTPNLKGALRAFETGVHKLNYVTSVSESHNQSNVRRSTDESVEDFRRIVEARDQHAQAANTRLGVGLSTAWGCSIEGAVDPDATMRLAGRFAEAGADELAICDTVGYANPTEVKALLSRVVKEYGDGVDIAAHFHDTRGLGLANVYASLEAEVFRYDATLGGLGGCPYAPNATGNIVMDDLIFLLEGAGLRTGVDLDKLIAVREIISRNLPNEALHGMYALAGAPKGFQSTSQVA